MTPIIMFHANLQGCTCLCWWNRSIQAMLDCWYNIWWLASSSMVPSVWGKSWSDKLQTEPVIKGCASSSKEPENIMNIHEASMERKIEVHWVVSISESYSGPYFSLIGWSTTPYQNFNQPHSIYFVAQNSLTLSGFGGDPFIPTICCSVHSLLNSRCVLHLVPWLQ